MTKAEAGILIAACLTTLLESDGHCGPEVSFYLVCDGNIDRWNTIKEIMVGGGLVTVSGGDNSVVRLTENGKPIAEKCAALIA